jgi:hypothetical protein
VDGAAPTTARGRSLTLRGGAPLAVGNPASHVFAGEGPSTQHVFHRTSTGEIYELWWRTSDEPPQPRNLTQLSGGALLAASDPVSHVFTNEGTQHVFYTADNGHIVELWWSGGTAEAARLRSHRSRPISMRCFSIFRGCRCLSVPPRS